MGHELESCIKFEGTGGFKKYSWSYKHLGFSLVNISQIKKKRNAICLLESSALLIRNTLDIKLLSILFSLFT